MITIFTPTYNRAHTLSRLYESLVSQDFYDFEWLIVDDGSSDGTKNLVEKLQAENKIKVRYVFQENGGKHIAINTGLKNAEGEWFLTVDSDDYLRKNALATMDEISRSLPPEFAGFTGIHFSNAVKFNPEDFGKKRWSEDNSYQWPHHGEMSFVFRTEVAKKFPFPVFKGEKFCQESLVLRRILREYKILFTDNVLIGGDYLEDGLSANVWKNLLNSPRYSMLNYAERITQKTAKTEEQEIEFIKNYWQISRHAKIPFGEALLGLPFKYSASYFVYKLLAKFRKE